MRAILAYHSVDSSGSVISVPPEAFRSHVRALRGRGVRLTSLSELISLPADADAVAVTFDDGFANFATDAWPVLQEHGCSATVFVVTDRVGGSNTWSEGPGPEVPFLPLLDWDQLARLHEKGIEIGSHTRTHADLRTVSPAALYDEIVGAADVVAQRIGRRPTSFAYPFGQTSDAAAGLVRTTYRIACTTRMAALGVHPDPHQLPRLDAFYFREANGLDGWGTPAFRGYVGLRAAGRRLRQLVSDLVPAQ